MVRVAHVLVLGIVVAGILGCQGGASGPAGYPVSGIVTYNQKPVDGAQVVFSPAVPGEKLQAASATTDSSGRYQLSAQPGEYVVVVTKYESPQAAESQAGEYQPPEEGQAAPAPKNLLPAKYADPGGSPLRVRVEAKTNEINLELTD